MVKGFTFLLIFLLVLGVFGRLRYPGAAPRRLGAARCKACGRPMIGKGPCACGGKA
ncbi:MAG: hypothetical protein KDE00_06745 [Rhodobacteraceae bacterium]|nr:hypothetical protein [Paracoccaceae bacterium]